MTSSAKYVDTRVILIMRYVMVYTCVLTAFQLRNIGCGVGSKVLMNVDCTIYIR